MLNRKNTADPLRISVWNDNVFNSFDLFSEEELKFYSFGDGGDGGEGEGEAESDPAEADTASFDAAAAEAEAAAADVDATNEPAEADTASFSQAAAAAEAGAIHGDELGMVTTLGLPSLSEESNTFSLTSLLGLAARVGLAAVPVIGPPLAIANTATNAIGKFGEVIGNETLANVGNLSVENIASNIGQEVGLPSSLTSPVASVTVGPSKSSISSPAAESLLGSDVSISAPIGSESLSSLSSSPIGSSPSTGGLGSLGVGADDGGSDSGIGIVDTVRQNPLAVRPQSEVASASLDRLPIRRRPFNFVPGTVFAQSGGGVQSLIKQGPTLLDVVNQGMSIPKQTAPTQRMSPAAFNKRQPGGLRSTNYYTKAMQPASFYAQPQQVRNYGSIY